MREVRLDRSALAEGASDWRRVCDAEFTLAAAEGWVTELRAIRIRVGDVEDDIGLNGTTCTLATEAGFAHASVRWWRDGPRDWSELVA